MTKTEIETLRSKALPGKILGGRKDTAPHSSRPATWLQNLGWASAIPAAALRVGDVTMWNGGGTETITGVETPSPATVILAIEWKNSYNGEISRSRRSLRASRLVAVASLAP